MATSSFITVLTKKNLAVSHWYFAHMRDKDTKCLTTTTVLNAFEFCYQLNHNMTPRDWNDESRTIVATYASMTAPGYALNVEPVDSATYRPYSRTGN